MVVVNENFNVDQAGEIGRNVLKLMENQTLAQFSFKSSWKFFSMATKFKILAKYEEVLIDQNLLFQRLTAIEKNRQVNLENLFKFELSPFPLALVKSPTKMHFPDKPKPVESLKKFSNPPNIIVNNESQQTQTTLQQIAMQCVAYVTQSCGINVLIVFDEYPQVPTRKDHTHKLRAQSIDIRPVNNFN